MDMERERLEDRLEDHIFHFCINTIVGWESALYKMFFSVDQDLSLLKTNAVAKLLNGGAIDYLNKVYASIIRRDDEYIVRTFDAMEKFKHSHICSLNFIALLITSIYAAINRSQLNVESYPDYMASLYLQLYIMRKGIMENFHMCENCSGEDIMKCDPNIPMFHMSKEEAELVKKKSGTIPHAC